MYIANLGKHAARIKPHEIIGEFSVGNDYALLIASGYVALNRGTTADSAEADGYFELVLEWYVPVRSVFKFVYRLSTAAFGDCIRHFCVGRSFPVMDYRGSFCQRTDSELTEFCGPGIKCFGGFGRSSRLITA